MPLRVSPLLGRAQSGVVAALAEDLRAQALVWLQYFALSPRALHPPSPVSRPAAARAAPPASPPRTALAALRERATPTSAPASAPAAGALSAGAAATEAARARARSELHWPARDASPDGAGRRRSYAMHEGDTPMLLEARALAESPELDAGTRPWRRPAVRRRLLGAGAVPAGSAAAAEQAAGSLAAVSEESSEAEQEPALGGPVPASEADAAGLSVAALRGALAAGATDSAGAAVHGRSERPPMPSPHGEAEWSEEAAQLAREAVRRVRRLPASALVVDLFRR